jgi:hypothetical protein
MDVTYPCRTQSISSTTVEGTIFCGRLLDCSDDGKVEVELLLGEGEILLLLESFLGRIG